MHECCSFLSLAGKKELKLSAADPAGRADSMEELVCLALVKCSKSRAGKDSGVRNLCFTGEQVFMLSDRQEAIAFCSKPQDKTNGLSNLLRATKRPQRSEHQYMAARSQRPSCSAGTRVRQPVEPGSAQWDQEPEEEPKSSEDGPGEN